MVVSDMHHACITWFRQNNGSLIFVRSPISKLRISDMAKLYLFCTFGFLKILPPPLVPIPNAIGTQLSKRQQTTQSPLCVSFGRLPIIVGYIITKRGNRFFQDGDAFCSSHAVNCSNPLLPEHPAINVAVIISNI